MNLFFFLGFTQYIQYIYIYIDMCVYICIYLYTPISHNPKELTEQLQVISIGPTTKPQNHINNSWKVIFGIPKSSSSPVIHGDSQWYYHVCWIQKPKFQPFNRWYHYVCSLNPHFSIIATPCNAWFSRHWAVLLNATYSSGPSDVPWARVHSFKVLPQFIS